MDNSLKVLIKNNLNSIIQQRFAEDKFELSAKKLKKVITDMYGVDIDDNILTDILSENPHVADITDDKITLSTETKNDNDEMDSEIHDTAVDQASKDLNDGITLDEPSEKSNEETLSDNDLEKSDENSEDDSLNDILSDLDSAKFESVADALSRLKTGAKINSSKINLSESNLFYHLHNGAKKAKKDYIISNIIPKKVLDESVVRCKIDKSFLFIELPIKCFVNKS